MSRYQPESQSKGGIVAAISQYFARAKTVRQLQSLSDRELKDIGLSRGEIYDVVAGRAPWRQAA